MSKEVPYIITNESVTVIWEGVSIVVKNGSPNYIGLKQALHNKEWEDVPKFITIPKGIESWSNNLFTIANNVVSYRNEPVPSEVNSRIIAMASSGENPTPLFKFWERLQKNPSFRSVEQLFKFLHHQNIPITPDGCFLAYKKVKDDYKDVFTGTVDNSPGTINEMPRNKISDDPRVECHYGYHVGAINYARSFGPDDGKMIVCKVDPQDVVCVPYDVSQQKMRVCKYQVVGNYGTDLPSTVFDDPLPFDSNIDDTPVSIDLSHSDDGEIMDEGGEVEPEASPPSSSTLPKATVVRSKPKKFVFNPRTRELIKKFNKLNLPGLMEHSIEELRHYATYGLKIVGASKISGGKVALVRQILKSR